MKNLRALVFVSFLLFSLAAGTLFAGLSSANFFPEEIPLGIQIKSDGSVEGTDRIQRDGSVYTFTGDIYNTIVVLRDGIVLDGAGYNLQGSGNGAGIFLQERNNVEIRNMKISNFGYGVKFTWLNFGSPAAPRSNKVSGSTITNNTCGIAFYDFSKGNEVSGNYIANNTYGVVSASNTIFRNNQFRNNGGAVLDSSSSVNDIDTSNTVNGKPVYYWFGQHDRTVPADAGWVVLKNCSGITVRGLSLEGNGQGVLLYYTTGSTISGNVITNNLEGITLKWSSNNVVSGNRVTNNKGYGVSLDYGSNNNIISNNEIAANAKDGINFESSVSNTVTENHVTENDGNGIFFRSIQDSNVTGNNISLNKGCGIGFGYGPNGVISGNHISRNGLGIWISNAVENTITLNTIAENDGWGIRLEGSQKNNVIHHNNFINNSVTEGLQASILGIWSYPGLGKPPDQADPPKLVPGAANSWDDGKEGNYWSDYTARYSNASAVGTSGVGNTPYFINENNVDRYPLMSLVAIREVPTEPAAETPSTPPTNTTPPEQQQGPAEANLATQYTLTAIAFSGIITASLYLFLKHKKPNTKTERA